MSAAVQWLMGLHTSPGRDWPSSAAEQLAQALPHGSGGLRTQRHGAVGADGGDEFDAGHETTMTAFPQRRIKGPSGPSGVMRVWNVTSRTSSCGNGRWSARAGAVR